MNDIDIVREAEEDLQREKLENLWRQYGHYVVMAIVLVVIGTGIVTFYDYWTTKQNQEATVALEEAYASKDTAPLEELLPELPKRHQLVANLMIAGKAFNDNEDDKANAFLEKAAQNNSGDPYLRDLATLYYGVTLLRKEDVQAVDVENALKPLLSDKDNLWHGHAKLYMAITQANIAKDYDGAIQSLEDIKNAKTVMPEIAQIAVSLQDLYTYRASQAEQK